MRNILFNFSYITIANVLQRFIGIIFIFILARYLGVEQFGLYEFLFSLPVIFTILINPGFSMVMLREVSQNKSLSTKYLENVIILKAMFGVIFFGFTSLFMIYFYPSQLSNINLFFLVLIAIIFNEFTIAFRYIIQAFEKMKYEMITVLLFKIFPVIFLIIVIIFDLQLMGVIFAILISNLLVLLYTIKITYPTYAKFSFKFDKKFSKDILIAGFPFCVTILSLQILSNIDTAMLTAYSTLYTVGLYSAAYKLIIALTVFPTILSTTFTPVVFRLYKSNKETLKKLYNKLLVYSSAMAFPLLFGTILFASEIMIFFFGNDYAGGAGVLSILSFSTFFLYYNFILGMFIIAIKKEKLNMILTFFVLILNIILNYFLINLIGMEGAAISTVVANILIAVSTYIVIGRKFAFVFPLRQIVKILFSTLLMVLVLIFLKDKMYFLIVIIIGMVFYFVVAWLMKILDEEDRTLLLNILKKAIKK